MAQTMTSNDYKKVTRSSKSYLFKFRVDRQINTVLLSFRAQWLPCALCVLNLLRKNYIRGPLIIANKTFRNEKKTSF